MTLKKTAFTAFAITAAAGALSSMAQTNEWIGLNANAVNNSTNFCDAANWSLGRVPSGDESVLFTFCGNEGFMGDLFIYDDDVEFDPHGDIIFSANNGPNSHNQVSDIYIEKPMSVRKVRIGVYTGSSGRDQDRLRVDYLEGDGATLTITGDGEAFDITSAGWQVLHMRGDVIFTGNNITFSDSALAGGSIKSTGEPVFRFANPASEVYLGVRGGATLSLGDVGLSFHPGQTWRAHENAYVTVNRNGSRSIFDSEDGGRLDNLGEVCFTVTHLQYGANSYLTLPGGTFGAINFSGGGSRPMQVTMQGGVSFARKHPEQTYGLRLASSSTNADNMPQLLTGGQFVNVLDGDLITSGGAFIVADNAAIFVNGDIRQEASTRNIGINGNTGTVVSVTGDLYYTGRSSARSGLYQSTVNAVGGGTVQEFEIGDIADVTAPKIGSFAIGTFNIGFGGTNAFVSLVNNELNDNPVVEEDESDLDGEKLVVGNLNVAPGSVFAANGLDVSVSGALSIAPDAWLDLNIGRRLEYKEMVRSFAGHGNFADEWNGFADRVRDFGYPLERFRAVCDIPPIETPVNGKGLLVLDGANDYVNITDDGLGAAVSSAFTVECWLRATGPMTASGEKWRNAIHRGKDQNLGTSVYWLGVHNGASNYATYGAGANGNITGSTGVAIDGEWHHLALSYDGADQRIYLDGVLTSTVSVGAMASQTTGNKIGIGASPNNASFRAFPGSIADVRIWNVARTGAEIAAAKDAKLSGNEPGLASYWTLDDAAGLTVANKASGSDGTLENGATWFGGEAKTFWQLVAPVPGSLILVK